MTIIQHTKITTGNCEIPEKISQSWLLYKLMLERTFNSLQSKAQQKDWLQNLPEKAPSLIW
jgi:hypothetical protein